ncbi:SMP-30/gluconolaconase/LRE-like protein [Streptomyces sp. Ag109_O5-1]|uniref:SMP-30/gluconolactonase/LRE family protein n=1 Tax=Streptomyces sp. Ag109_O5-1 TaxID=1938851 RepID=UPI000F507CF4|nr:SMP-30/gluconolactonase/LRE family protein [Streptomyces sp. Ag109_O5-1]RPE47106.1 SMP-30/gluconolaconase/LRE-like protein [Streptomyces sp. Ag109_O5-1]
MKNRITRAVLAGAAASLTLGTVATATDAQAATEPVSRAHIVAHFDLAKGQSPENALIEPNGSVDVTFAGAHQVARVDRNGTTHILATLPAPSDNGVHTPVLGFALATGLARTPDGTLYALYATGTKELTGLWRLKPGHQAPERIAALPADSLPNGLAFDPRSNTFYITDSVLGRVWSVPAHGGRPTTWSTARELAPRGFLGANGARVHDGALWVTNLDQGTVVRIPIRSDHRAGKPAVKATGLQGIDDFAFTGRGNEILAALNKPNKVVRITDDGKNTTALNASDGLQNPTSVAVRGPHVYVPSAAYATTTDPNLLHAQLNRHGH